MKQHSSSSSSSSVETLTDTCDFLVEPFHAHVTAASPPIGELQQRQPEHPERARVFAKWAGPVRVISYPMWMQHACVPRRFSLNGAWQQ